MNESQLLAALADKDRHRYNQTIQGSDISVTIVTEQDRLKYQTTLQGFTKEILFTDSALSQLLNRLDIDVRYYKRCPDQLKLQNISHWLSKYNDRGLILRMDPGFDPMNVGDSSLAQRCRAVLSDTYGIIDDVNLFTTVFHRLNQEGGQPLNIKGYAYDEKVTSVQMIFDDIKGEVNGLEYQAGFIVTNSETGHSSVWIEPVVFAMGQSFVSRNSLKKQGFDCRIIHKGYLAYDRIKPMVDQARNIAQVGILQLVEAMTIPMNKGDIFKFMTDDENIPTRFIDILEEEWGAEDRIMKAAAAQRIMQLAATLPLFNKLQVEQSAGKLVGVFDNYHERFSEIVKAMNS